MELIKKLSLDEVRERLTPETHPKVPWASLAHVLVISRFCEPSSELRIAEDFYRKSALSDLLGIPDEDIYDNRHYRALDKILGHKDALQRHLKERLGDLFDIKYDILLYDVTSSYFEGEASKIHQPSMGIHATAAQTVSRFALVLL